MPEIRRLVIVSHVPHYRTDGVYRAYRPYAREIDIWADLFPEVVIAAPLRHEPAPGDCLPFTRRNISVDPQREAGGDTLFAKLRQFVLLPAMLIDLAAALRGADAIHVRCPGNLGLLGAALAPLFSRRLVAKYAGQWNGYAGEPIAARLQRVLLASQWWKGPVTVYGEWPDQPAHIVPFFTSMMTDEQVRRAERIATAKEFSTPLRVSFVGALQERKRASALIEAVRLAMNEGVSLQVTLVGDGPERAALERRVAELGLADVTTFTGALPFDEVLRWHEWSQCLVLPSRHSEGWPKAVAEAMAFGALCIAVDHGQLSSMLDTRGVLLRSGTPAEIAQAIVDVARHPARYRAMAQNGALWAGQFSLEGLRRALAQLLSARWDAPISARRLNVPTAQHESLP